MKALTKVSCKLCGKRVAPGSGSNPKVYCSTKCQKSYNYRRRRVEAGGEWDNPWEKKRKCKECNKLLVFNEGTGGSQKLFCDRVCRDKNEKKNYKRNPDTYDATWGGRIPIEITNTPEVVEVKKNSGLKVGDLYQHKGNWYKVRSFGSPKLIKQPFKKDGTLRKTRHDANGEGSRGGMAGKDRHRFQVEWTREDKKKNPEKYKERDKSANRVMRKDGVTPRAKPKRRKYTQEQRDRYNAAQKKKKSTATKKEREARLAKRKAYYDKNKEATNARARQDRIDNPAKYAEYQRRGAPRHKERRKTDPHYNMVCRLRQHLRSALRLYKKSKKTLELTGCSLEELKRHIESKFTNGMSWDVFLTRGVYGIHIDHIKPCASFDLSKESEQRKCFHYTNLQPMWALDNIMKGDKYDRTKARSSKKV